MNWQCVRLPHGLGASGGHEPNHSPLSPRTWHEEQLSGNVC